MEKTKANHDKEVYQKYFRLCTSWLNLLLSQCSFFNSCERQFYQMQIKCHLNAKTYGYAIRYGYAISL